MQAVRVHCDGSLLCLIHCQLDVAMTRCELCGSYLLASTLASSAVSVDAPDAVKCTSLYSSDAPYTGGHVVFALTDDRSVGFLRL